MSVTEEARQTVDQKTLADQIAHCEDVIKEAATYERLVALADFAKVMADLKNLIKIHQEQINGWMGAMAAASFFKRQKIMDTIMVHQIRKEQLDEAVNYPQHIIHAAIQAREFIRKQREKEKSNA